MGLPWDAYYVLTKAEARMPNSKIHPNTGAPNYDIKHDVADISDIDTSYLKLDGSNANQDIDIGAYNLTGTAITADTGTFVSLDVTGRDFSVTTASDPGAPVRFFDVSALDRSITLDGVGAWTFTAPAGLDIEAGGTTYFRTRHHFPLGAAYDLGASGANRWQHLYLHGNLDDGTNQVTVANAKTAFDHVTADGDSHGFIDQDVTVTGTPTFAEATITDDFSVDSTTFAVDSTSHRVGIGTITPSVTLDVLEQTKITSTGYPVLDLIRDTTTTGSGLYAAVRLKRLMTGGTALDGSGIVFYFETPDDAGTSTFAASFGAGLYDVSDGAEKGFLAFNPSNAGVDPSPREALKIFATGVSQYANTVTVNLQAYTAIVKPETSLQVETHASNAHIVRLSTNHSTADDLAGISFGVHTSSSSRIAKSAIVHQRKGSWGQGDLVFLVDAATTGTDVAITDEVMRLTSAGLELTGTAKLGDGGTTNYAEFAADGTFSQYYASNLVASIDNGGNIYAAGSHQTPLLQLFEKSSDPAEPAEGQAVIWLSDGTGYGDDGDVCIASQAGGTTKKAILFDHSAGAVW